MMVIDATDAITGRLAAFSAKQALKGEEVVIVNAEKAVISGNAEGTVMKYAKRREMQNKADPRKSPSQSWAKRPDKLLKRIISGMLPKHSSRRKHALERIMVHMGVPKEFEGKAKPFGATSKKLFCDFISLKDICAKFGWVSKA